MNLIRSPLVLHDLPIVEGTFLKIKRVGHVAFGEQIVKHGNTVFGAIGITKGVIPTASHVYANETTTFLFGFVSLGRTSSPAYTGIFTFMST